MKISTIDRLSAVKPEAWNKLVRNNNPFLRHEFLSALETHQCVGEKFGWLPQHLLAFSADNELIGALPLYLKDNSYGELVFDWAWADAYHQYGLDYYPKLVNAIPYTPATCERVLHQVGHAEIAKELIQASVKLAQQLRVSSLHSLFPPVTDLSAYAQSGLFPRLGCQFHWHNDDYRDFEDFVTKFNSKKRKNLKRERRRVREAGIEITVLNGKQLQHNQWLAVDKFYRRTFYEKGGVDTLNLNFFQQIGEKMGDQLIVFFASLNNQYVAAAICFRSDDTLYGRHWGCQDQYHSLHFELCYYQGIEYCINNGLKKFEPGAQGEHKINRGFIPTATWSTHWLAPCRLQQTIKRHVDHENSMMESYILELRQHLPFKQGEIST